MKAFRCGDVVTGCTAEFEAESQDELYEQIRAHARDDHGMDEVPPEVVDEINAAISDR
ncbi:MAG TPA: DUF1059 domain-containing protein [Solirubrobacteraceae bacterium]|nr:DUF1059 domain-containing protein [Solirubrobacteraceae bacterium]